MGFLLGLPVVGVTFYISDIHQCLSIVVSHILRSYQYCCFGSARWHCKTCASVFTLLGVIVNIT